MEAGKRGAHRQLQVDGCDARRRAGADDSDAKSKNSDAMISVRAAPAKNTKSATEGNAA
jgi:hypothetical protein